MAGRRVFDVAPLVGRQTERSLALEVLRRSDRRAVVLAGPAGVGKSRLADEIAADAERAGYEVRSARVTAAAAATPLGGLAAVLPRRSAPVSRRGDLLLEAVEELEAGGSNRLLVVDDAHLLDAESAAVLHLAASRGNVALLATLRTGEPVDDALTALWKDGFAERLDLGPLSRAETEDLGARLLGGPLDGVSAGDLYASSEGNPLFVRELLVGALDDGRIVRHGELFRFTDRPRSSPRLAELLGARLDEVVVEAREALELLAVAGELGLDALLELVPPSVLERVEQLGLIVVGEDGQRRPVRLAHPLYGELLRARMGRIRQMAVNRTLADQLEAFGARRTSDLLALARWRLVGGGEADPDRLLEAARQAFLQYDHDLALQLAAAAERAGAGVRVDVIATQALMQLGRQAEAVARLEDATHRATEERDVLALAIALSVIQFWSLGDEAAALATVEAARARLHHDDTHAQLAAHGASFEAMADRPLAALALVEPYLAAGEGLPYLLSVMAAGPALSVVGRAAEALELAERCLPLRLASGDEDAVPDVFKYLVTRVFALGELGSLSQAVAAGAEAYELARSVRAVPGVAWAAMLIGRTALLTGQLAEADSAFAESSELFADLGEIGLRSWCLAGSVLAAAMAGDAPRAAARLVDLDAVPPNPVRAMQADMDRARGWARSVTGDAVGARAELEDAIARSAASGTAGHGVALVHDLARIGDERAARLLTPAHRAVQGPLAATRISFLEALAAGDGAGLDACGAAFDELGAALFALEAAAAAAAAHQRAGARRRSSASASRVEERRAACPQAVTPLLGAIASVSLTARERDVAELAAAGLASHDIAVRLGRSVRTVDNHLQRVYDKLGVSGRHDLPAALRGDGE